MASFLKFWFPLLGYSGIIFYISSVSSISTPMPFSHFDKFFHIGEYMPFGFLAVRALKYSYCDKSRNIIVIFAVILAACYGISDEYHQSFVEGRSSSWFDVMADAIGGFFGAIIFCLSLKRRS